MDLQALHGRKSERWNVSALDSNRLGRRYRYLGERATSACPDQADDFYSAKLHFSLTTRTLRLTLYIIPLTQSPTSCYHPDPNPIPLRSRLAHQPISRAHSEYIVRQLVGLVS